MCVHLIARASSRCTVTDIATFAVATRAGSGTGRGLCKATAEGFQCRSTPQCAQRREEGPRARRVECGTCENLEFAAPRLITSLAHRHVCRPKFGILRRRWTLRKPKRSTSSVKGIALSENCSASQHPMSRHPPRRRPRRCRDSLPGSCRCGRCKRTGRSPRLLPRQRLRTSA